MNSTLWSKKWPAPAKLNLMLRIVGRRDDGYHKLQTVFQIVDYCDYLQFSPREDNEIVLDSALNSIPDVDNLVVRAARALSEKAVLFGIDTAGVTISLTKNLPMGGGLGGGSSDAATTLVVLNHLWKLPFSNAEIAEIGLQLGADVPVFIHGSSAWAEGVGEELKPMDLPEYWYVVLIPDCHVSTKDVFCHPALTRDSESITMDRFSADVPYNDCLSVVSECYPEVKRALSTLEEYPVSGLTGTGGCVFASFSKKTHAHAAASSLSQNWTVFVAKALNRSPLHQLLAAQNG